MLTGLRAIRLALVACVVAVAAACGGSDDQPQQVGESAGLTRYEVSSQGFRLGVPPEWRVISVDEALPDEQREELARQNPEFAPVLDAIGSDAQPIKLFAFDPEIRDAFATNVNVVVVPLPAGAGLQDFVEANLADIRGFPGRTGPLGSKPARLPGGPAQRLEYRLRLTAGGRRRTVATLQYLLVGPSRGYVVTFSTLPDLSKSYAPVFGRIVQSLRLD